ncbi:MAG: mercury methylation corrinoid protein HgcA [Actinobacteria bacterium]|nr:mercury methylation corrinoid protein HgcA [Actinomycetota bacterium]
MSECCPPQGASCCGLATEEYEYGQQPFECGEVVTLMGPVPVVSTELTRADRLGALRVRANIGRSRHRVRPGLYAIGEPDDAAPVLVTGNYKLTLDVVRSAMAGRDAWLLVIDSRGINVWCAAGKGVFGTAEVVRRVRTVNLPQVVSHTKLVLPQLAATGVAAHEVRVQTGFSVVWGPVRAVDLPAFLDAGMKATEAMRRVEFRLADRAQVMGVELSVLWRPQVLAPAAALLIAAWALSVVWWPLAFPLAAAGVLFATVAVIAGAVLTPLLLPWLPGRAFALKGATAGAVTALVLALALTLAGGPAWLWGMAVVSAALASFVGMNFTGSSTYTSPSGVEWEMRRAIPVQVVGVVVGIAVLVAGAVMGG